MTIQNTRPGKAAIYRTTPARLSPMSVSTVMHAYPSAYFQCKLDGDKIPSARAIQTLVQAWREMRGWSKRH